MTPDQQKAVKLAETQRVIARRCLSALEHDLSMLRVWDKEGELRSHNLDTLISSAQYLRTALVRAEAYDEMAKL